MNRSKEPMSNIVRLCDESAPKPNPQYRWRLLRDFIGTFCKLAFHDEGRIEHMWVRCTGWANANGFQLEGTLDNYPVDVTNLEYGDPVLFNRSDIEDVYEIEEARI
jgi:Uncharacterized protein conserved in bacteria (DUF2314)